MYLGRGTMTKWFISENKKVHLKGQEGSFNGTKKSHGLHTTIVECSPWFLFIKEQRFARTLLSYNDLLFFHNI